MNKLGLLMVSMLFIMTSCVKKKDFLALQENKDLLQSTLEKTKGELDTCNDEKTGLMGKIAELEATVAKQQSELSGKDGQITTLKGEVAAEQAKQATIYSSLSGTSVMTEAEVKQFKAALETINGMPEGERNAALTKALTAKLTNSLSAAEAQGMEITTKGGAVMLSLSDKILYNSGRTVLTNDAKMILDAVAKVINANGGIDVLVEGHADADPVKFTSYKDNWNLSVKRAMKVANYLEKKGEVAAARLTIAGRGEHDPKADNATEEGKAMNRRTEIMLVPGLDDYFRLVTGK